uniref:Uncharacterized protein n=1 Tax=Anguilla anguilla TaxID=7936 RepID=A0A0E9Y2D5_ANGAN
MHMLSKLPHSSQTSDVTFGPQYSVWCSSVVSVFVLAGIKNTESYCFDTMCTSVDVRGWAGCHVFFQFFV